MDQKNIPNLVINHLSEAQFEDALKKGLIMQDELYLTPGTDNDTEVKELIEKKQDKLTAGTSVTIGGNVIFGIGYDGRLYDTDGIVASKKYVDGLIGVVTIRLKNRLDGNS